MSDTNPEPDLREPIVATIGQWADYFDTGIWSLIDGQWIAPEDLTMRQLRDHLLASGGAVYLAKDDRFHWIQIDWSK